MTSRDFNNRSGQDTSSWDGPDIGVWNPAQANTGSGSSDWGASPPDQQAPQNNQSAGWSNSSQYIPNPQAYRESTDWNAQLNSQQSLPYGNTYQAGGDINSDWRSQNISQFYQQSQPSASPSYPDPDLYQQRANTPTQQPQNSYQQQATYLSSGVNGSIIQPSNAAPVDESLQMTFPNSDTGGRSVTFTSPGSFRNPLLDSSDPSPEELLNNLHIEEERSQRLMANRPVMPSHIPQSSLIMLQKQLMKAAEPLASPEALRLARERELGFHSIDDIGTLVVVSNLSAQAASFTPRSKSHVRVVPKASEEEASAILNSLSKLVENVQSKPGNFDNLSAVFVNQVRSFSHSKETIKEMVDMIFSKAIVEDNFQYLGARLCDVLTTPDVLNGFRTTFLNQLQAEFKRIDQLFDSAMTENIAKIHGFVTFMAEIFIHLKINGNPIVALGKSFGRFLEKLLTKPASNVNFVCKMLKLTGAKLRDALSGENTEIYENVFKVLKDHSDKQTDRGDPATKTMLLLIASVLRLKDSNWGRTESNSRKKSSIADPVEYGDKLCDVDENYYMNEPVFFTPDGVQYTAAEAQIPEFYDQHLAKYNVKRDAVGEDTVAFPWNPKDQYFDQFVPSEDEDELYNQDPQGEEYDDEYEKFLAESGQLH